MLTSTSNDLDSCHPNVGIAMAHSVTPAWIKRRNGGPSMSCETGDVIKVPYVSPLATIPASPTMESDHEPGLTTPERSRTQSEPATPDLTHDLLDIDLRLMSFESPVNTSRGGSSHVTHATEDLLAEAEDVFGELDIDGLGASSP